MRAIFVALALLSTQAGYALQCGSTQQTAEEARNLRSNRGPVNIDGQIRYGAYTVNKGDFHGKWAPGLFCGFDGLAFEYDRRTNTVAFFECRGGQVYYNVNGASGVDCK